MLVPGGVAPVFTERNHNPRVRKSYVARRVIIAVMPALNTIRSSQVSFPLKKTKYPLRLRFALLSTLCHSSAILG